MDHTPTSLVPAGARPTPPPAADGLPTRPDWRVGDQERGAACDALARHFALGRLSPQEFDERLDRATRAVVVADLRSLQNDLPPLPSSAPTPALAPRFGVVADVLEPLLMLGAVGAFGIVALMLLGSLFLGPGILFFSLVGGSLTAFFAAVFTRAAVRHKRPDGRQQP